MNDQSAYGHLYWCIGLPKGVEVYLNADKLEIDSSGALLAWRIYKYDHQAEMDNQHDRGTEDYKYKSPYTTEPLEDGPQINLAFAAGKWEFFYAASVFDGSAVAVQHWKGQIAE